MSKIRSKAENRTISIIAIIIFVISIVLVIASVIWIMNLYKENDRLNHIKDNLVRQIENQSDYKELHEDQYYTVYVEDDYAVFNDTQGDPLIVYSK